MIQIINKKDCCGCTACLSVCPKKCINMEADEEGYLYPKVDTSICIECHLCEKVCPILNPVKLGSFEPKAYAVQHKVLSIRENSASAELFRHWLDAF
jgi:formate hydrogenlyase subunit 6/NADH:ubiquinone oxidoreductase subunit I